MIRFAPFFLAIAAALCVPAAADDAPSRAPASGYRWVDHPKLGQADLLYDGKPALRYMYAFDRSTPERTTETFKVYHHVFGPGTGERITNGAGGLFPHHRGLFVGWRQTRFPGGEIDSWHCINGAHQRHLRFLEMKADGGSGSMSAEISWNDGDAKPVVDEIRTVRVSNVDKSFEPAGWQIDWTSRLSSRRGAVELAGDRQHAGFQFRAAQSVADSKSATYIRPKGFPQEPQAIEVDDRKAPQDHINLGWLAMSFPIKGATYTVAYFEDPSLPKPSRFSERPYGRFGAYFKTTLQPDHPLLLRYRLLVTPGKPPNRDAIQAAYDRFVVDMAHSSVDAASK